MLPAEAAVGARGSCVISTVAPGQETVRLVVLQQPYPGALAADCVRLGAFELENLPPSAPGQVPRIEVTLRVTVGGVLTATALDLDEKRHAAWCEADGQISVHA